MATPDEIAQSIVDEIRENGAKHTYQHLVVARIRQQFGEEWSYLNDNQNWAIHKDVLKAFRALKDAFIVWNSSNQSWHVANQDELDRIAWNKARRAENKAAAAKRRAEQDAT